MLDPSAYEGREQTYVKHFFLENYLERVAYNIFSFTDQFAYVDGFSGPWKSATESYEDTSFSIATNKLLAIQKGFKKDRGKIKNFRCLFIEKDHSKFRELESVVADIPGDCVRARNSSFEDSVPYICDFAQNCFSLTFIDPTGWQGLAMDRIKPVLNLRGEVLINFMWDFINRFLEDPRPEIAATFDELFGSGWYDEWRALSDAGLSREVAALEVYKARLKSAGNFSYVTSTRILKPTSDRSYFYLIYATEHWKGIQEFRKIEKKAVDVQERIRDAAKFAGKAAKTGQPDLFGTNIIDGNALSFEDERRTQLERGYARLEAELTTNPSGMKYELLLGAVLETPLVWESDLKKRIGDLQKDGKLEILDLAKNKKVPTRGSTVILKKRT